MATPLSDTPLSPLKTIAVVGLGTMGTGIAEVLARAGREVVGIDISEAAAAPGRRRPGSLAPPAPWSAGGSPSRSAHDALARFRTSTDLQAAADADLVIEVASGVVRDQAAGLPRAGRHRPPGRPSSPPAPTPCP